MFNRSNIIVGLEIGTSKACVVVGELDEQDNLNFLDVGTAPSCGSVCKGEIINNEIAEEIVREALALAEDRANIEIGRVYLGVSGGHIKGFNNRGVHTVVPSGREIDEDDIGKVVRNAQPQLTEDQNILHTIRQHFGVDGQEGVESPIGRLASRLEVEVHVVSGQTTRLQNPVRVVEGLGVEVEDIAFNGRVSGLAAVSREMSEQGVILIDLGGGTTEYAVYLNGSLRHSGVIGAGGEHVTNDIGVGLNLTHSKAEKLKLDYGSAISDANVPDRTVNFPSDVGLDDKPVKVDHLHQIMNARLDELLCLIRQEIMDEGLLKRVRGGLRFTGGGARTPNIDVLGKQIFEMDVIAGYDLFENGPNSLLNQPEYITAIGLVKYGAQHLKQGRNKSRGLLNWLVGK